MVGDGEELGAGFGEGREEVGEVVVEGVGGFAEGLDAVVVLLVELDWGGGVSGAVEVEGGRYVVGGFR